MNVIKITDDIFSVGMLNPNLRIFDIIMKTEYGTSYNSYIVKGSEKTALIETCHATFFESYLKNIKEVCDLNEISYIVLNHDEPDHSGALAKLCELMPNAEIVVSQAGSLYLKNITNKDIQYKVVKDGDSISLGDKTLKFITAPFLHWPDSMFTWVEESKALFSCDFLGAHYCEPQMIDTDIAYPSCYDEAFKGYYNAIFGPFKPYVLKGIDKMKDLGAEFVCTSHGPVLTKNGRLASCIEKYVEWSKPETSENKKIPIFYCSAYGNTAKLAEAIKQGINSVIPNADVALYNIIDHDMGALAAILNGSSAFAVGSPTINRDAVAPVWVLLSHIDAINNIKKPCAVFGSFGWSGEAVPMVKQRLEALKLNVYNDDYKINFVPSNEQLKAAEEFGKGFAETLK